MPLHFSRTAGALVEHSQWFGGVRKTPDQVAKLALVGEQPADFAQLVEGRVVMAEHQVVKGQQEAQLGRFRVISRGVL